jgi:Rrf2 family protein
MPLSLSTRGRYGVRLMVALAIAHGNGSTLLREVARREGISEKYLGQIIMPLKSAGLVVSQRGSHGGYALARAPDTITVRDVVEAIEGSLSVDPGTQDPDAGTRATYHVSAMVWQKLAEDISRSLSSVTLSSLAREARELTLAGPNYEI